MPQKVIDYKSRPFCTSGQSFDSIALFMEEQAQILLGKLNKKKEEESNKEGEKERNERRTRHL